MALIPDRYAQVIGSRQGQTFMAGHICITTKIIGTPGKARSRQGQQLHRLLRCCVQGIENQKILILM